MIRLLIITYWVLASCLSFGQAQYEVSQDPKHPEVKVLRGLINRDIIKNDTSFNWYKSSQGYYSPDTSVINALQKAKSQVQYVIFGGTWCEDTQFIFPKFFKLQELSGVPDDRVTVFGVNRDKVALGHIAEAFAIINVPTIIVMKDGKEIGRIVEYGKTGKWDKELADLLK